MELTEKFEGVNYMSNESKDSIASYLSRVMNADGAPLPKKHKKIKIAGEEHTIDAAES